MRTLQAARALGDCLVVCLNSDASVRRLKGAGARSSRRRTGPRVLLALDCVDAVEIFDEDTPTAVLRGCGPTSGSRAATTPSATCPRPPASATWGGRAVVLPFLEGRSTTRSDRGGPSDVAEPTA